MIHPVGNYTVTQAFGGKHTGIDWGVPLNTPIKAVLKGVVISSEWNKYGYGNLIIIKHIDNSLTYYAHLNKIFVDFNTLVKEGEVIGLSGSTGNSTGPHLHFEYRIDKKPIDPLILLNKQENLEVLFYAKILTDNLNLRSMPTTACNTPIKQLKKDTVLEVTGIVGSEIWLRVPEGYVCLYKDGNAYLSVSDKRV